MGVFGRVYKVKFVGDLPFVGNFSSSKQFSPDISWLVEKVSEVPGVTRYS